MDGKLYKRLRLAMGLTTPQLAERLGLSEVYINSMERGARVVTEEQADAICKLLLEAMRSDDPCFAKLRELIAEADKALSS